MNNIGRGVVKLEEKSKVIVLPCLRSTNIKNVVNTSNVAFKDEQDFPEENNINYRPVDISNDLNDLISNIHGESQLIEIFLQNEKISDNKLSKSINLIKQNCLKLTKTTNKIIEFEKIKEKHFYLYKNNINIVEIIDYIAINITRNIKDIKIIFDTNIEEKFMPFDIHKFQKAILILLSNAIKFSDENEVFVNLNIDENNVNIAISFRNKNNKLLDVFIDKMDNIKFDSLEDLSLDFYLCKSIIELHDGNIFVGGNTDEISFSINLPCENTDSIYYLYRNNRILKSGNLTEQIKIEFSDLMYE